MPVWAEAIEHQVGDTGKWCGTQIQRSWVTLGIAEENRGTSDCESVEGHVRRMPVRATAAQCCNRHDAKENTEKNTVSEDLVIGLLPVETRHGHQVGGRPVIPDIAFEKIFPVEHIAAPRQTGPGDSFRCYSRELDLSFVDCSASSA